MINQNIIERATSVKYLGVYLDEKMTWSNHIQQLSLQLAKTSGIFYRLREYVTRKTLCMLYYSLVYSRVQHGISIWETTTKSRLYEINVRLNNIVRTISWKNKFTHVTDLYKELQFLKQNEIYELELAKFMYQLHHHQLPDIYFDQFTKIEKFTLTIPDNAKRHYTFYLELLSPLENFKLLSGVQNYGVI